MTTEVVEVPAKAGAGALAPAKTNGEGPAKAELTTAALESSLRAMFAGPEGGQELPPTPETEGSEKETVSETVKNANVDDVEVVPAEEEEAHEGRTEWPESAQKRVDKLTAQKAKLAESLTSAQSEKQAAEDRVAELEAKLSEGEQAPAAINTADPLGFIKTPKELSQYVAQVKGHLRNVEDFLDDALEEGQLAGFTDWAKRNGAVDAEGQFNTARLKQLKRTAQDALGEMVPQRMQFLQAEATQSAQAEVQFPWLKDAKAPEHAMFRQVLNTLPEVRRLPHWKAIAAIFVRGLKEVQAETKKAAGKNGANVEVRPPGAARTAPKLPGAAVVLPQRTATEDSGIEVLRTKAFKTGNPKDFEALIKAQLAAAV